MTYNEVLTAARGQMGPCKACPVCDGRACRNTVPGPGAKGVGDVAIRNYSAWQNVRVNMDTICESGEPDTTLEMFGHSYRIPVFAGPVGAMQLHYGTKYTDLEYNDILVPACHDAGILAFTGDGTNPAVMVGACKAVKANAGFGIPTVKPWDAGTIAEKMALVRATGAFAVAMDIDAARRQQNGGGAARHYCGCQGSVHHQGRHDGTRRAESGGSRCFGDRDLQPRRARSGPGARHSRSSAGNCGGRQWPLQDSGGWRHPHGCGCI